MKISVRLYSILRQRDGQIVDQLELNLPAESKVKDALNRLNTSPDLDIILTLDGLMVDLDTSLHDGATLALIPAVAGGK